VSFSIIRIGISVCPFGADVITPRPHYDPGALPLRQSMYTVATLPCHAGEQRWLS
jgi:hypothetical protein